MINKTPLGGSGNEKAVAAVSLVLDSGERARRLYCYNIL